LNTVSRVKETRLSWNRSKRLASLMYSRSPCHMLRVTLFIVCEGCVSQFACVRQTRKRRDTCSDTWSTAPFPNITNCQAIWIPHWLSSTHVCTSAARVCVASFHAVSEFDAVISSRSWQRGYRDKLACAKACRTTVKVEHRQTCRRA